MAEAASPASQPEVRPGMDGVEEPESSELFRDLGMLVVEGRTPGGQRGFHEGPHCVLVYPYRQTSKHVCNPRDQMCQRDARLRRYMHLLWRNNVPMSVEVLLCPSCVHGEMRACAADVAPEPGYILLEQWTVHMETSTRYHRAAVSAAGLLQAVYSYLHFSQLSAWLSNSCGAAPRNVMYRISVPGDAFHSKSGAAAALTQLHTFPYTLLNRDRSVVQVSVRSLPRCDVIPASVCLSCGDDITESEETQGACASASTRRSPSPPPPGPQQLLDPGGTPAAEWCDEDLRRSIMKSRLYGSRDSLLGDSLLDPPRSLHKYPKRYQSPSRSGSPSLETPEHLMFGSSRESSTERRELSSDQQLQQSSMSQQVITEQCCSADMAWTQSRVPWLRESSSAAAAAHASPHIDPWRSDVSSSASANTDTTPNTSCQTSPEDCHTQYKSSESRGDRGSLFQLTPSETQEVIDVLSNGRGETSSDECASSCSPPDSPTAIAPAAAPVDRLLSAIERAGGLETAGGGDTTRRSRRHAATARRRRHTDSPVAVASVTQPMPHADQDGIQLASLVRRALNFDRPTSDATSCDQLQQPPAAVAASSRTRRLLHERRRKRRSGDCPSDTADDAHRSPNLLKRLFRKDDLEEDVVRKHKPKPADDSGPRVPLRRSLDSAECTVFNACTGLPLSSSPAPLRRGNAFSYDHSLTKVKTIGSALNELSSSGEDLSTPSSSRQLLSRRQLSSSCPAGVVSSLLGNFEESVLNGRLGPVTTVQGFSVELGASGSFHPRHLRRNVTVFFYSLADNEKTSSPYMGHVSLGGKGYHVPRRGTLQVTLFNPHGTVVKMFVVLYDLSSMPPCSQTFIRQRTLYMPVGGSPEHPDSHKWLRYLIHLRFATGKTGRLYLHTDLRMIIFRKSDLDAASVHTSNGVAHELRSFVHMPENPRYSPRK